MRISARELLRKVWSFEIRIRLPSRNVAEDYAM